MVTKKDVNRAQSQWAEFLVKISSLRIHYERCVKEARDGIDHLYSFPVLFKPTFAKNKPFRTDPQGVLSYFVGGNVYPEDKGFALKDWRGIRFENASMILKEDMAFVMGHYFFVEDAKKEIKVEFTFGYLRDSLGQLRICLHHSSLP